MASERVSSFLRQRGAAAVLASLFLGGGLCTAVVIMRPRSRLLRNDPTSKSIRCGVLSELGRCRGGVGISFRACCTTFDTELIGTGRMGEGRPCIRAPTRSLKPLYRSVGLRKTALCVTIEGEGFVMIRRKASEDFKGERAKVFKVLPQLSAVSPNPLVICGMAERDKVLVRKYRQYM